MLFFFVNRGLLFTHKVTTCNTENLSIVGHYTLSIGKYSPKLQRCLVEGVAIQWDANPCRWRACPSKLLVNISEEICDLLGYYTASNGNPSPTFWDNISVPSSRVKKS
jgi:hypothetical protein